MTSLVDIITRVQMYNRVKMKLIAHSHFELNIIPIIQHNYYCMDSVYG